MAAAPWSFARQLGWLLALWVLGVGSLAAVALALRVAMNLVGLTA